MNEGISEKIGGLIGFVFLIGVMVTMVIYSGRKPLPSAELKLKVTDLSFNMHGVEVFSINGFHDEVKTNANGSTYHTWKQPESPADVNIRLTTKDGKKWQAKWVPRE